MGRWVRESDFDDLVAASVDSATGVRGPWPVSREQAIAAVKAIIAKESAFDPAVYRGEPQAGDASVGLMQLLLTTARSLGYPGDAGDPSTLSGLFEPGTNIYLGTLNLWDLLTSTGGDLSAAFSAYNGGYRPELGFGAVRTADTPTVCLQWKPTAPRTGRSVARDCQVIGSTTPGTFSNQRYVDLATNYYAYFFGSGPGQQRSPAQNPQSVPPSTFPSSPD